MTIVSKTSPVTLVGGSKLSEADLTIGLSLAPTLVAIDGGANRLLSANLRPAAVIGDLDSIDAAARAAFADVLHLISEQTSTDFDKALRHIDSPLILALGVLGGRLDHELAALNSLVVHPDRPCIALGEENIVFVCPPQIALPLIPGTAVSLYPMGPVGLRSTGLAWPTDHLTFDPSARIGTSNAATGPVRLWASAPVMLVILPRDALETAAQALLALPRDAKWPARDR